MKSGIPCHLYLSSSVMWNHVLFLVFIDNSLHSAFKKDGGIEKILEHIQLGIHRDGESNTVSL